jgi:hypothetical protein
MRETPNRGHKFAMTPYPNKEVSVSPTPDRNDRRDVPADHGADAIGRLDGTFVPPCQKRYAESRGGARTAACSNSTVPVVAR